VAVDGGCLDILPAEPDGEYFGTLALTIGGEHSGILVLEPGEELVDTPPWGLVWGRYGTPVVEPVHIVHVALVEELVLESGCSSASQPVWEPGLERSDIADEELADNLVWELVWELCCRFLWELGYISGFLVA